MFVLFALCQSKSPLGGNVNSVWLPYSYWPVKSFTYNNDSYCEAIRKYYVKGNLVTRLKKVHGLREKMLVGRNYPRHCPTQGTDITNAHMYQFQYSLLWAFSVFCIQMMPITGESEMYTQ